MMIPPIENRRPLIRALAARSRAGVRMRRRSSRGFTLLEVMLALALSAVLMGVLSMMISVTLRATNTGRTDVAHARLAASILRKISADLRNAIQYEPPPTDGLFGAMSTAAMTSGGMDTLGAAASDLSAEGGAGASALSGLAGGASGAGGTSGADGMSAGEGGDPLASAPSESGLYGTLTWLEVDTSRAPTQRQLDAAYLSDIAVSDLRTVGYYLGTPESAASRGGRRGTDDAIGISRRAANHMAMIYGRINGVIPMLEEDASDLAPEVRALEFHYFDGTQWLEQWDSAAMGHLPPAVEVAIVLAAADAPAQLFTSGIPFDASMLPAGYSVHRMIVHLPAARPPLEQATAEDDSNTQNSSAGGSPMGGAGGAPMGGGGGGGGAPMGGGRGGGGGGGGSGAGRAGSGGGGIRSGGFGAGGP